MTAPAQILPLGPRPGLTWDVAKDFGILRQRRSGAWYLRFNSERIYSAKGTPFESREQAEMVLAAIRAAVAGGASRREVLDRWLPSSSRQNRIDTWLAAWLERMQELERCGEKSRGYLEELERWCEGGDAHCSTIPSAQDASRSPSGDRPCNHISAFWGQRSVQEVDYSGLERWGRWLTARGLSAKTRHNVMGAFHSFLGWCLLSKAISAVPPFPWPRVQEHAPTILSSATQAAVLAAIPSRSRGIFLALAGLGLRPSEAMQLRVSDYEPGEPGWLTVRKTKNGQVKRLPVPEELAEWLNEHRGSRNASDLLHGDDSVGRLPTPLDRTAPLFPLPYCGRGRNPHGGPWNSCTLRNVWVKACRQVGVKCKLYEGTKHSTATEWLRRQISDRTIQALLGHKDARSTKRYARLADQALVEAIRRKP